VSETQSTADDRWPSAYDNAAERLFPQAFDASGKPARALTWAEDDACIAEADAEIELELG